MSYDTLVLDTANIPKKYPDIPSFVVRIRRKQMLTFGISGQQINIAEALVYCHERHHNNISTLYIPDYKHDE